MVNFYIVLKNVFFCLLSILILTGCATSRIGETLPGYNYTNISDENNGHDRISYNEYVWIDFNWEIDNKNSTITLDGKFNNNHPEWDFAAGTTSKSIIVTFDILFMDQYEKINGEDKVTVYIDESNHVDMKNLTFSKKIPYRLEYEEVYICPKISGHYLM